MKLKKVCSKFLAILVTANLCMASPITAYATFNANYSGAFYSLSNQYAFINVTSSGCTVNVVYSPLERQYLRASGSSGYLNNSSFYAEFPSYTIVNNTGGTIRHVSSATYLNGNVDVGNNYIDIIVGGIIYEQNL